MDDHDPYPWRCSEVTRQAIDSHLETIKTACQAITDLGGVPPLFFAQDDAHPRVEPAALDPDDEVLS